jgi:hypothetical protein
LAFAAENAGAAEMLAEAQWFVRSLALHYARIHSDGNEGLPWTVRPATDAEATVYRSRLAEFAEEADQLLVVPVNVP